MKVLHLLAGGDVGGIETLMRDYARYSKHENHFIVLWGENGNTTNSIKAEGYPVTELQLKRGKELKGFCYIRKYCIDNHISVALEHHAAPLAHLYLLGLKHLCPNITTIAYAHSAAEFMCRANEKKGLLFRKKILFFSLKHADAVVSISEFVQKTLIDYFTIPADKIHVIYNGTPFSTKQKKLSNRERSNVKIIYVGRLIEQKGVQLILRALAKIEDKTSWSFSIIGDGSYRAELESLCKKIGIEKQVTFMGTRSDIPEQLATADIFVHMPVCQEGFGITITEAMAMGLVCVCGNSGAIPEIITEGENGFLVDYLDTEALAIKLSEAIENYDSPEIECIRKNAMNRAKDFSIIKFAHNLDRLYGAIRE